MSALQLADSVRAMPKQNGQRGHAVPIPGWWGLEAVRKMKERGITQPQLAEMVAELLKLDEPPSQSQMSRCLSTKDDKRVATIELVGAVSRLLALPPPVFIAANRQEAIALQRERLLVQADLQAAVLSAGVPGSAKSAQTNVLRTEHENSAGPSRRGRRRRVERGRTPPTQS